MAVITISRQYGSGGTDVATRVCELLGYRYFDKDLMADVAHEAGLSPQEVVDFPEDEHQVGSFLDRLFGRTPKVTRQARVWKEDATGSRSVEVAELDTSQSIAMVRSIIQAAYRGGDVVSVGRGGQVVLKGLPGVLHVRIEAPLD